MLQRSQMAHGLLLPWPLLFSALSIFQLKYIPLDPSTSSLALSLIPLCKSHDLNQLKPTSSLELRQMPAPSWSFSGPSDYPHSYWPHFSQAFIQKVCHAKAFQGWGPHSFFCHRLHQPCQPPEPWLWSVSETNSCLSLQTCTLVFPGSQFSGSCISSNIPVTYEFRCNSVWFMPLRIFTLHA